MSSLSMTELNGRNRYRFGGLRPVLVVEKRSGNLNPSARPGISNSLSVRARSLMIRIGDAISNLCGVDFCLR